MKLLLIGVLLGVAYAQPAFEVASIKGGRPDAGFSGGCHGIDSTYTVDRVASAPPLGRCVVNDARLSHMLGIAFNLRSLQFLKGGPDWVKTGDVRFNVEGKAEDPTKATEAELLQMFQAMLIERFSLKFHRETRDVPGFALVVAKNGPKLKDAKGDREDFRFSPSFKPRPGELTTATARKCSMATLAEVLTQIQPSPVNDQTGLTGTYDFTLTWDEMNGPQLTTALQQELGLRLESQKVPVSFFIIDSAQKPSEN